MIYNSYVLSLFSAGHAAVCAILGLMYFRRSVYSIVLFYSTFFLSL